LIAFPEMGQGCPPLWRRTHGVLPPLPRIGVSSEPEQSEYTALRMGINLYISRILGGVLGVKGQGRGL